MVSSSVYTAVKRSLGSLAIVSALLGGVSTAQADPVIDHSIIPQIDFRNSMFSGAHGQTSFSATVDWIDFTVYAEHTSPLPGGGTPQLWWDSVDGLGVMYDYENDEIEGVERLRISFDSPANLSHLFFSDLFVEPVNGVEGAAEYTEFGFYQFKMDGVWEAVQLFDARTLGEEGWGNPANGEARLTIDPPMLVEEIRLWAPGAFIPGQTHEFALLGITDPPISEPGTLLVFGAGLFGLGAYRRRRKV